MTTGSPRIAIIGYGDAREYAFYFRLLAESGANAVLFVLLIGDKPLIDGQGVKFADSPETAVALASKFDPDLVLVLDPNLLFTDLPTMLGFADLRMLGPGRASLELERSKLFMKRVIREAGIATPDWHILEHAPPAKALGSARAIFGDDLVLKSDIFLADANLRTAVPDGFVAACEMLAAQRHAIAFEHGAGARVFAERHLKGTEISVHLFWDGETYWLCPPSQDFKRVCDGNTGPNTHGAAAFGFGCGYKRIFEKQLTETILMPLLQHLRREGLEYRGFLYLGIMVAPDGEISVLEINVRPGNPEIVALLALYDGKLGHTLCDMLRGDLHRREARWKSACVSAVLFAMAEGYPARPHPERVKLSTGLSTDFSADLLPQGVGEDASNGDLVVTGGRVTAAVGTASTAEKALDRASARSAKIQYQGRHARTDLASWASELSPFLALTV